MLWPGPNRAVRVVRVASAAVLSLVSVVVGPIRADASSSSTPAYTLTAWASEKGLPPGDVFVITQDVEGYLWLGTPTDLLRFDGSQFASWTSLNGGQSLPNGPVHTLLVSRDKSLWVGFGGGAGIARLDSGRIVRYSTADGAPPGANGMVEDRQGTIWVVSRRGLFRYANGRWSTVGKDEGYPGSEAFSLFEDRAGRLWVGTATGVYVRTKTAFELADRVQTNVQSFAQDQSGAIWVTDTYDVVKRLNDHMAPEHDADIRLPAGSWRLMTDRRGQVWVAAFGGGLLRINTSGTPVMRRFEYEHKLAGSPRSLYEDREGNLWVGMRGGLVRLSESAFNSATPLDGLTHDGVRTTAVLPDGSVWIGTGHSLNKFSGSKRDVYGVSQTNALHADREGVLWVSTTHGLGRMVNGRFVPVEIPQPIPWNSVMSITTDSSGLLFLCSRLKGVMAWDGKTLSRFEHDTDVTNKACESTFTDRRDRVWIGFQGGGAALYEKGTFQAFTERDGMTRGTVLGIIEDASGAVWLSTSGGVSRYQNGRFTSITQVNAPLVEIVPVLVEDDDGYVWVGVHSGVGVIRFHPREVDKIAANPTHHLEYALYDETDGMQQAQLTWQSGVGGVRGTDGRLWMTSGSGITIIDPRNLPRSRRPSPPRIEAVVADGRNMTAVDEGVLPARTSMLHIEYATLSLSSASKLRFRYRLEGFDDDWVYAGARRDATYRNLPSGDYRFRVSTTHDGQWTEAAAWGFSIAPPFYLTRWFLVVAAFSLVSFLAAAWWLRMRALKNRYVLVFAERARVSREIHDTLLQGLAALGVELEAVASQLDPSQATARDELRRLRRQVGHSLRDARESILELRRNALATRSVADSLRELADKTTTTTGVRVDVCVNGRRPLDCAADIDIQLFRIGQEAMTNAIRHGRATHVIVTVTYERDRVVLSVCDDGCGFTLDERETARETGEHLGLLTMRERAARIRGRLNIITSPGTGTTIETMIPVPSK